MEKAILIFGPSGVGKSYVSKWFSEECNFLHYEADLWPKGDGIDFNNLRPEWDLFFNLGKCKPLADLLKERAKNEKKNGTILSLTSIITSPELLLQAEKEGLIPIILYGRAIDCINAFLEREKEKGTGTGIDHWFNHNAVSYIKMGFPSYDNFRIMIFKDGMRCDEQTIVGELLTMINK